jgi:hypothetical protein
LLESTLEAIGAGMQGKTRERWMQLAEQAANEQDSEKLLKLVDEINRMLDAKEDRLKTKSDPDPK